MKELTKIPQRIGFNPRTFLKIQSNTVGNSDHMSWSIHFMILIPHLYEHHNNDYKVYYIY